MERADGTISSAQKGQNTYQTRTAKLKIHSAPPWQFSPREVTARAGGVWDVSRDVALLMGVWISWGGVLHPCDWGRAEQHLLQGVRAALGANGLGGMGQERAGSIAWKARLKARL